MSNSYFQFKQFIVYHDQCAMKVGVDGVLLGAWAPIEKLANNILDVGTGSGLIALMLAQRTTDAQIDAIDIDEGAFQQAKSNVENSVWKDRISVKRMDFHEYYFDTSLKYDLIVANPPYFISSLKAADKSRSRARHTDTLSHESLLQKSMTILQDTGRICLILPVSEGLQCVKYAENISLFCYQCVYVYPTPAHKAKRILLEFGFMRQETKITHLEIETNQRHSYSEAFTKLVKDFYIKL